nr:exosporium glycoprotein BclB-related protein [Clostridium sp. Marseille-Q2269]
MIPYASGTPVGLVTVLGGLANTGGLIGFGASLAGVGVSAGPINLGVGLGDYAFVVPRAGTITSLAGFFSTVAAVTLLSAVEVNLQLYLADAASNTFNPVGTPLALTPNLGPVISIGDVATGLSAQNIPVLAQQKLLLVAFSDTLGIDLASVVTGFISAGITIDN